MSAPTLISYTEVAWTTTTSPKTTASITWQTSDVVATVAGADNNCTLGLAAATGLTFSNQQSIAVNSTCAAKIDAAVAASSSSATVSMTNSLAIHWGYGVWVYRGSQGIGNSAKTPGTPGSTRTLALTPTAADGAILWGVFDWNASAVTSWNATPPPTNVRQRVADGSSYTLYVSDLADQVSSGSVSYGIAGTGAGSGPYSIVVLEIKAGAGGGTRGLFMPPNLTTGGGGSFFPNPVT